MVMKKEKLRSEIFDQISQIKDETILKKIFAFIQNLEKADTFNEPQALYEKANMKSDFSELHQELRKRSMAVSEGEYITQEDLENESKNW